MELEELILERGVQDLLAQVHRRHCPLPDPEQTLQQRRVACHSEPVPGAGHSARALGLLDPLSRELPAADSGADSAPATLLLRLARLGKVSGVVNRGRR